VLFKKKTDKIATDRPSVLNKQIRSPVDAGRLAKRHRISEILPFLSFDPERRLIFSSDRADNASIGAVHIARAPLSWANDALLREMRSAISTNLPRGSFLQILRFDVPDIKATVDKYRRCRSDAIVGMDDPTFADLAIEMSSKTADFFSTFDEVAPFVGNDLRATDSWLVFAVSIRAPEAPMEETIEEADRLINNTLNAMPSLGFQRAGPEVFLGLWRRFLHYFSPWDFSINENELLREQIPGPGDALIDCDGAVESVIGRDEPDTFITPLSLKEYPESLDLTVMDCLLGDASGVKSGCADPVLWSWTARIPDQNDKRNWVKRKSASINYQAFGPAVRFIPSLAYRKQGMDNLVHQVEKEGDTILEVCLTALVFSRSKENASRSVPVFQSHCQSWNFDMRVDDLIPMPVILNALPLFPTEESTSFLYRFKTLSSTQACSVLPIFGDWRGPGEMGELARPGAGTLLLTRRGNPAPFDIFSSLGNYNFFIAGSAGSGKSVLAQGLIADQLSLGAQVWVIEIGRSSEKLCKVLGGTHLSFDEHTRISMNPFSLVQDFDDELDELTGIHATMISPTDPLSAEDKTYIKEAIRSVYSEKATRASPTDVSHFLFAQPEPRPQMLARMMHDFTENGAYGDIFKGQANVNLNNRFTVLELEDLQNRKGLQAVILLQLMFAIQREMYRKGERGRRRILFVDEASELLQMDSTSSFLQGAYRRARKHKGSIGVGIQNISDLFLSASTEIIASQSEHRIMLFQEPESINRAAKSDKLSLNEYGVSLLHSLRKMKGMSEMVIASGGGTGVFRSVVDPYRLALFSTSGKARDQVLNDMERGMSADAAIRRYLDEDKPGWERAYRT
jgi:conjugal transfer ATP-binding protein TraC